jgi:hypothetical protein
MQIIKKINKNLLLVKSPLARKCSICHTWIRSNEEHIREIIGDDQDTEYQSYHKQCRSNKHDKSANN